MQTDNGLVGLLVVLLFAYLGTVCIFYGRERTLKEFFRLLTIGFKLLMWLILLPLRLLFLAVFGKKKKNKKRRKKSKSWFF